MSGRFRLISIVVLGLTLLALPTSGTAAAPDRGGGPVTTLPGGAVVNAPAVLPGTQMGAVGFADVLAWGLGTADNGTNCGGQTAWNSLSGSGIWAPLSPPAGATIWQIDFYGCTNQATTQTWNLNDETVSTGALTWLNGQTTSAGPGVLHATMSFASGLTPAAGHELVAFLAATSSTSTYVGVIFQYTLPTLSFVPLAPARVLDTRDGTGGLSGPFTVHAARTFIVVGGTSGVPVGAKAVTGNLTVTEQTSLGYLYIGPAPMNNPTTSTLNFPARDDRANGVTVALSATGTLSITFVAPVFGPTAHAIFDVTGYYE